MEFELNEILDIIENDFENSCNKYPTCGESCKYYKWIPNCSDVKDDIEIIRRLAAACFSSNIEEG